MRRPDIHLVHGLAREGGVAVMTGTGSRQSVMSVIDLFELLLARSSKDKCNVSDKCV